jgi:hypothetical protein
MSHRRTNGPGRHGDPARSEKVDSYFLTRFILFCLFRRVTRETRVAASVFPDSFLALSAGAFGEIFFSATMVTSPPSALAR